MFLCDVSYVIIIIEVYRRGFEVNNELFPRTWQEFMNSSGYMPVVVNSIERHLMQIGHKLIAIINIMKWYMSKRVYLFLTLRV